MAMKENVVKVAQAAASGEGSQGWDDIREYRTPRAERGGDAFIYVSVNGRSFSVPFNQTVKVPYPVYERLLLREKALDAEQETRNAIPNEAAPTQATAAKSL